MAVFGGEDSVDKDYEFPDTGIEFAFFYKLGWELVVKGVVEVFYGFESELGCFVGVVKWVLPGNVGRSKAGYYLDQED